MADLTIDWASMGWYHVGDVYQTDAGFWYRLVENPNPTDGRHTHWARCLECTVAIGTPTPTTTPGVTIQMSGGTLSAAPVPEPSTIWLLGLALGGVVLFRAVTTRFRPGRWPASGSR